MRIFAQRMKDAILSAHGEVIEARVKQTRQANKNQRRAEFTEGDLVYLSTKNLKLPKHRARKLTPKYIGPFRIVKEMEKGVTYQLELSPELKKREESMINFMPLCSESTSQTMIGDSLEDKCIRSQVSVRNRKNGQ